MTFVLSTDSGGTFLDLVLVHEDGRVGAGKALHTHDDPKQGIEAALGIAAAVFELSAKEALARCQMVFHGTTVTTNGMVERNGATTGLLCTKGFEDTLAIGRVKARTEGYDALQLTEYTRLDRTEPIVPFPLIVGINERIDPQGRELAPLDVQEVQTAAKILKEKGASVIAVSFLHAYRNNSHEVMAVDAIRAVFPELELVASHDIAPVIGEYERTNTVVLNAYLNGLIGQHLDRFEGALKELGYQGDVLIMQSNGGVSSGTEVRHRSVFTLLSGPVGGVIGSLSAGKMIAERNIITTDMGGTSFDVGIIVDGEPEYARQLSVAHQILLVPGVDVEAIGAGGGSIVWLDENKNISIGPASAGARPGPASYGFGGENPTITDADIVLGFVDPDKIVLGDRAADRSLGARAIREKIADPLGISVEEAANAVLRIVNNRMADLIRKVTVERGYDPADFAILAYGGSGPAHCFAYGREIGASKIVVPPLASVFSAYGIAQSDIKYSYVKAVLGMTLQNADIDPDLIAKLNDARQELEQMASGVLSAARASSEEGRLMFGVDMRFAGQVNEMTVPVDLRQNIEAPVVEEMIANFIAAYEQHFGKGSSSKLAPIEFVTLNADVVFPLSVRHRPTAQEPEPGRDVIPSGQRRIFWDAQSGWLDTPIFDAGALPIGKQVKGPAVVELFRSSIPVAADQVVSKDGYGNLILQSAGGTE